MCGIFGWIGNNPKKNFSIDKFNILGLYNDSRGGDSCGRVWNTVEYSKNASNCKKYEELVLKYVNPEINDNSYYVLGHTRKASVGNVNLENAQPVILTNNKNEPYFILLHNGTLLNHEELAKKYKVPIKKTYTDSKIFAKLLAKVGTSIFSEYLGAGAFVWVDLRISNKKVFIYKGESKLYKTSVNTIEERPLHLYKHNDQSCYISSIDKSLLFIGEGDMEDSVIDLNTNSVYEIDKGSIRIIEKIDRNSKDIYQTKTAALGNSCGYYNYSSYKINNYYGYNLYDDLYENDYGIDSYNYKPVTNDNTKNVKHIAWNMVLNYHCDGVPCNGVYEVNDNGVIISKDKEIVDTNSNTFILYFVKGYLLKDYIDYLSLTSLLEIFPDNDNISLFSVDNWIIKNGIFMKKSDNGNTLTLSNYNGKIHPFFTPHSLTIENGIVSKTEHIIGKEKYKESQLFVNNTSKKQLEIINDDSTDYAQVAIDFVQDMMKHKIYF